MPPFATKNLPSLLLFFGLSASLRAANITTPVTEAAGQNWENPAFWSDGLTPHAGAVYEVLAGARVRNVVLGGGATNTFHGDQLIIDSGGFIRWKGPVTYVNFPGVGGQPGLVLKAGSTMDNGDDVEAHAG